MPLRHVLAVAILPCTVTVLVPVWLAEQHGTRVALGASAGAILLQAVGLAVLAVGASLFAASLRRFAVDGWGTLAPWDPPRRLVVQGPYRYVRNPMISGAGFVLAGEAMLLCSVPHAKWAAIFMVVNAVYIPLVEEAGLRRRYGDAYREYCRHVPRLVPRLRPWSPPVNPGERI